MDGAGPLRLACTASYTRRTSLLDAVEYRVGHEQDDFCFGREQDAVRSALLHASAVALACLLGLCAAEIDLDSYEHDDAILFTTAGAFLFLWLSSSRRMRSFLLKFAALTFILFVAVYAWFWGGWFEAGWWFPEAPGIVQLWSSPDGEAGLHAMMANTFLAIWLALLVFWLTAVFVRVRMDRRSSGQRRDTSVAPRA